MLAGDVADELLAEHQRGLHADDAGRVRGAGRELRRGGQENKHSTDVESPRRRRASVCSFTLKISHAPMSIPVLVLMTLSPGRSARVQATASAGSDDSFRVDVTAGPYLTFLFEAFCP